MNNKQLKYYLDRKCSEDGCIYLCAPGYTICEGHLYGFPRKLPDEVIAYLEKKRLSKYDRNTAG